MHFIVVLWVANLFQTICNAGTIMLDDVASKIVPSIGEFANFKNTS